MAGQFKIKGGPNVEEAHVIERERHDPGLMVYNHPADQYEWGSALLSNNTFATSANINPAGSPTLTLIHNGGDNVGWTAAAVSGGGFDFTSTAQAFDGTQSIDATVSVNNDIAGFTAPSPLNPQLYGTLQLRVYITAFATQGNKDVEFQWESTGAPVGNAVSIKPYCDTTLFNTWQLVNIPISDFGLSTTPAIDELTIKTVDTGPGLPPDYYLDAINLTQAGADGTESFIWRPGYDEDYNLVGLTLRAYNSSKQKLAPTEFFGLAALTNGCVLNYRDKNRVFLSLIFRDVWDMLRIGSATGEVVPDNSTGATFGLRFNIPSDQFRVDGSKDQYIELIVRDDLTGLNRFMITLDLEKYTEESR